MNSNTIAIFLAIISIIVPIVIAYYQDKRKKFFFIIKDSINLYEDITKSSEKLKILFDDVEIKKNLFLITGIIFIKETKIFL